jgi:hypothetical protein
MTAQDAAAELYRLAQAETLLRLFRHYHGRPAATPAEVEAWVVEIDLLRGEPLVPTDDDLRMVQRANPDLYALATGAREGRSSQPGSARSWRITRQGMWSRS